MDWSTIKARLDRLLDADKRSEMRGALCMLNNVDIAEYLSELDTKQMLKVFRILPKDISSDVFSYMDDEQKQKLIESISDTEAAELISDMFVDDAVDFLEELPAGLVKRVLANVSEEQRKIINRFFNYPDGSAGSIMTIEFCELHTGTTVEEAFKYIKRNAVDKETVYTLYVLDSTRKLLGTIPLRKLITADEDTLVENLMNTQFVSAKTHDDRESVAELVRKYDLMSVPIVDNEDRLVGIVTADDIIDVIQEEATEDIEKMNALLPSEDEYLKTSTLKLVKNRLPWLLFMLLSSIFTETIIDSFSARLSIAFTACIPMLMGTGGNCGSQSSTLAIRGLAVGEIAPIDALKILWKEFRVSLMVSAALSCVSFCIQKFVFARTLAESLTIAAAMIGTVVLAKSIGCLLPLLAKQLKLDPALMAAPLITTIVDVCSLLILVLFATVIV